MAQKQIISDPDIMMGKPVVAGTRITGELILEKLASGETIEQLLSAHPQLTQQSIQAVLAMKRVIKILGYLTNQIMRGRAAFISAKHLAQALEENKTLSSRIFFKTAYFSCIESSILTLSKLALSDKKSVNINYLLNCAEQSSNNFPYASKRVVLDSISKHKNQLLDIAPFMGIVKAQRNKTLAHLDKSHVNNPDEIFSIPDIDIQEVGKVFQLLLDIVDTYEGYARSSQLHLTSFEKSLSNDIDYLMELIDQATIQD